MNVGILVTENLPDELSFEMIRCMRHRFMNVRSISGSFYWKGSQLLEESHEFDAVITTAPYTTLMRAEIKKDGLILLFDTEDNRSWSHPNAIRVHSWYEVFDHLARKQIRDRQVVKFR